MATEPHAGGNDEQNPMLPRRCGAKTRAGTPCQRAPVRGKARCYAHGGWGSGRPIEHGCRANPERLRERILRENPEFGRFLDAIAEEDANGATLTGELTTLRARLLQIQRECPKPEWEAALAGAIVKLAQAEERLRQLIPLSEAKAGLGEVMGVVRSVVDPRTWEIIIARLGARGFGAAVHIAECEVVDRSRPDGARRLSAGPVAEELPDE